MNCKCLTEVEKKVKEEYKHKGAAVISAKIQNVQFIFGEKSIESVTSSEVKLEVEGRKTPVTLPITHTYCPFCGVKNRKEELEEETK